jgi:hypothetical protein
MRVAVIGFTAILAMNLSAMAQEWPTRNNGYVPNSDIRREAADSDTRPSGRTSARASSTQKGVWPPCQGVMWEGSQCQNEDGKICRVDIGNGGQAYLASCR